MKPFGDIESERILAEDELFTVAWDKYPVSPGHTLIIIKRVVARFSGTDIGGEAKTAALGGMVC